MTEGSILKDVDIPDEGKKQEEVAATSGNGPNVQELIPEVGMLFASLDDVKDFYSTYAKRVGFGTVIRNSGKRDDGVVSRMLITCAREGNPRSSKANAFKPNPTKKVQCQARITAVLCGSGSYKINKFVSEHNHELCPTKFRYFRSIRKSNLDSKSVLELTDRTGIRMNEDFDSFVVLGSDGYEQFTFNKKDGQNYIDGAQRLKIEAGGGEALISYFARMQECNESFFSMLDIDDDLRIRNVFWADGRSRATYKCFGDVVTFDTTYMTNKYDMPLATFIGVNHHGQSVLLGCALLSNENTSTFVWVFNAWLKCMNGVAPNAIITDHCQAMCNAIQIVFPNTRYRICLWHIMKKLPEKVGSHRSYDDVFACLKNVVYDSLSILEFEEGWERMLDSHDLRGNSWLANLYEIRVRWAPAFLKDSFWAGMSIHQRSDNMNAFFDKYVTSKTSLRQFLDQYDNALREKAEKSMLEDLKSFNRTIPCITVSPLEEHFQKIYTNLKFEEVQEEFRGKVNCYLSMVDHIYEAHVYVVREDVRIANNIKEKNYKVTYEPSTQCIKCECGLFEFTGILCRHVLLVLMQERVCEVPSKYILNRWRKDLRHSYLYVRSSYDDIKLQPVILRYERLVTQFRGVAEIVAEDEGMSNELEAYVKKWETMARTRQAYARMQSTSSAGGGDNDTNDARMEPLGVGGNAFIAGTIGHDKLLRSNTVPSKRRPSAKRKITT